MAKISNQQRVQIGGNSYLISNRPTLASSSAPVYATSKQSFSIHINRNGHVEIASKPVVSVTHASGHSVSRDERAHSSSVKYPRPPRSDVATIGSSTYLNVPTSHYAHSSNHHADRHAQPHEHRAPSPRHHRSVSASPQDSSRRLLDPGHSSNDRQHHRTSPHTASIPIVSTHASASSPQKHAHFSLPRSMPNESNMTTHAPPPSPRQASRHHHTHSHESYFRHRPHGWYNRRGDQFVQRGVVKRQPHHLEWDPVFATYPDPGTGYMDERGHFLPQGGGILKHSSP